MNAIVKKYEALLDRKPSKIEYQNLLRISQALNLRQDDAFWTILIVLEDYGRSYQLAPARIETAVENACKSISDVAERETRAAAARAIEAMADETARIAKDIADKTAGRDRAKWITIAASICTLSCLGMFSFGFAYGYQVGASAAGLAAEWAMTKEGQTARALAETGSLYVVTDCLGEDWYVERQNGYKICRTPTGAGWYIP